MEARDYLEELYELRKMLKVLLNKEFLTELVDLAGKIDDSFVQRYVEICEESEHGKNCGYASRARDLYLKMQDLPIREKISQIYHDFIEEKN